MTREQRRDKEALLSLGQACLCDEDCCPRCIDSFNIFKYEWANDDVKMCYIIQDTWLSIEPKENRPLDINQRDAIAIARHFYSQIKTDIGRKVYLDLIGRQE